MGEWSAILVGLGRTTIVLVLAMILVRILLRVLQLDSPTLRRWACLGVLLQGWLFLPLTISIPWYPAVPLSSSGPGGSEVVSLASTDGEPAFEEDGTQSDPDPKAGEALTNEVTEEPGGAVYRMLGWCVVVVWLNGMVLSALVLGTIYVRFVMRLPHSGKVNPAWLGEWQEVLEEQGVGRQIPLRVVPDVGPMLCLLPSGYTVIVPRAFWTNSTPNERRAILRHELSHYLRGDVWKSWAMYLLALPHWFNPAAWWAVRTFKECAEWSCDQAVASTPAGPLAYLRALQRLVETRMPTNVSMAGHCAHSHPLVQRVKRILHPTATRDTLGRKALLVSAIVVVFLVHLIRVELIAGETVQEPTSPTGEETEVMEQPAVERVMQDDTPESMIRREQRPLPPRIPFSMPVPRHPGRFIGDPLMRALDGNGDGKLSEAELARASIALSRLDRNKDGQLTPEECQPHRPRSLRSRWLPGWRFTGAGPRGRAPRRPGPPPRR